MRTTTTRSLAALVLMAACLSGCGGAVRDLIRDAPRTAVPGIADESLNVLEDAGTRERIAAISATPEMHDTFRELGDALVTGGIDAVSSEETNGRMRSAVERLFGVMRPQFLEMVHELVGTVTHALIDQLADPEVRKALRVLAAEVAQSAVESTKDTIIQIREERSKAGTGLIEQAERVMMLSLISTFVLGAFAVALFSWSLSMRSRARRYRAMVETERKRRGPPTLTDVPVG